jgi:hypothetical protein
MITERINKSIIDYSILLLIYTVYYQFLTVIEIKSPIPPQVNLSLILERTIREGKDSSIFGNYLNPQYESP